MASDQPIDHSNNEGHQSLTDHLADLRKRIVNALIVIVAGAGLSFFYSEQLFEIMRLPVAKYLPSGGLVYTGIMDKFNAHIQLSLLSGVVLTAPLWLYQVWLFVAPGLYKDERRYGISFLISGTLLFIAGVAFCYFIVYPTAFEWLFNFGGSTDKPMITISEYMSFFIITLLLFGASFELPLILVMLGIMGLIDVEFLRDKRRFAYVGLAILAAILTPPDVISQLMMLGPLVLLYESAIVALIIIGKREKKLEQSV